MFLTSYNRLVFNVANLNFLHCGAVRLMTHETFVAGLEFSVIFVLIYFLVLVLVLVFQLFFRFSFVLVFIIFSF